MQRTDDTGFGGIKVIQSKGSGYGVDAVLLAAFAAGETGAKKPAKRTAGPLRIADLGTGCGVVAFILYHKLGGAKITGYEVNEDAVARAEEACRINGLEDDVDFVCGDIAELEPACTVDAVVTNPPYFRRTPDEPGAAEPDERYIARHETTAGIDDFCRVSASMLKDGGSLYMVHRPDRLADIFESMRRSGIEPKEMQMVLPQQGKAANIVLIHGIKGAGPELRILPAITVHGEGGGYTGELLKLYGREG